MEYRKLGRTDLRVSILGFGTAPFGGAYGAFDPQECKRAVDLAIDHGINFFDSSPYYGITLSEQRLGDVLQGKREKVVLATKCGRYGLSDFDFSAKRIIASIDESLKRLKTDCVDLFQVHDVEFGDIRQIVAETLPAVRKIQQQGKARFVGITGYPLRVLIRIAKEVPVDTILSYCHYNLMNTDMDRELTPFAAANGIGLINASGLHMGMLTEGGAPEWHPAPAAVKSAAKRAVEFCRSRGKDISPIAIRFCLEHPYVSTTLVGMSTQQEVRNNLQLLQLKGDPRFVEEIRSVIGPDINSVWPSGRPENND
jgi:L-galactose dehydrogenase